GARSHRLSGAGGSAEHRQRDVQGESRRAALAVTARQRAGAGAQIDQPPREGHALEKRVGKSLAMLRVVGCRRTEVHGTSQNATPGQREMMGIGCVALPEEGFQPWYCAPWKK